jgi:hypothetical protein
LVVERGPRVRNQQSQRHDIRLFLSVFLLLLLLEEREGLGVGEGLFGGMGSLGYLFLAFVQVAEG